MPVVTRLVKPLQNFLLTMWPVGMVCLSIWLQIEAVQKLSTTAYHPQTDGLVKNFNRNPRAMVANMLLGMGRAFAAFVVCLLYQTPWQHWRISSFMVVMPAYPVSLCCLLSGLSTRLILTITEVSWCLTLLMPGELLETTFRSLSVSRREIITVMLRQGPFKLQIMWLSRPYIGPFQVLQVHPNGVTVVPVDRPKDPQIRVNLDWVALF